MLLYPLLFFGAFNSHIFKYGPKYSVHNFYTSLLFHFQLRKVGNSIYCPLNPNVSTIILKKIMLYEFLRRVSSYSR